MNCYYNVKSKINLYRNTQILTERAAPRTHSIRGNLVRQKQYLHPLARQNHTHHHLLLRNHTLTSRSSQPTEPVEIFRPAKQCSAVTKFKTRDDRQEYLQTTMYVLF